MLDNGPQPTLLGKFLLFMMIAGCVLGGAWWIMQSKGTGSSSAGTGPANAPAPGSTISIGVAYGTEKRKWLEWAVEEFAKAPAGQGIVIELKPMGSLQGAQAILGGDQSINAWTPASSLAKDMLVSDWQVKRSGDPILSGENLALTPMALVWWQERHQAFAAKYGATDLKAIAAGLQETGGWAAIAKKPEWGLFKFGHTDPASSNSGLIALVTMAYVFHNKAQGLSMANVLDAGFQGWLGGLAAGASGTRNESTGTMMREMILKGPSAYDCLLVYESIAIEHLANAEGRWGALQIDYPAQNFWNDNPYYVLNVPWSTPGQRAAAKAFQRFLLAEPAQRQALVHGFRPADPAVPVLVAGSPFEKYKANGLRNDIGSLAETPRPEVIQNLLQSWQRARVR